MEQKDEKTKNLFPVPLSITKKYKEITITLDSNGFSDGYGETYYNSKDIDILDKIISILIKEGF